MLLPNKKKLLKIQIMLSTTVDKERLTIPAVGLCVKHSSNHVKYDYTASHIQRNEAKDTFSNISFFPIIFTSHTLPFTQAYITAKLCLHLHIEYNLISLKDLGYCRQKCTLLEEKENRY